MRPIGHVVDQFGMEDWRTSAHLVGHPFILVCSVGHNSSISYTFLTAFSSDILLILAITIAITFLVDVGQHFLDLLRQSNGVEIMFRRPCRRQ